MTAFAVLAAGGGCWNDAEAHEAARDILRAAGRRPRRVNRFIEIALAGAIDCCGGRQLPADCGVYLATRHGDVRETALQVDEIQQQRVLPMPVSFINLSGNMAGYYIAQALGVHGPNLAISAEDGAFFQALEFATLAIASENAACALVGHVEDSGTGACSHWMLLGDSGQAAHATLERGERGRAALAGDDALERFVEFLRASRDGELIAGAPGASWRLKKT